MDGRIARGDRSRDHIIKHAVDIASVDGLDGLSLGALATRAEVSKSGIAVLFGTKEQLQLATVAAARAVFIAAVITPALNADRGLPRIRALVDAWIVYSRDRVFAGGCFFIASSAEFDSKGGPVRDAILAALTEWNQFLASGIRHAVRLGQLDRVDVAQYVFETTAFLEAANSRSLLLNSSSPYESAKQALRRMYGDW